ncbi:hypothetical protein [Maribacter sp. IgM3_T14_3]|uniref:hypothetical protein n=1 Tax=Maribacter sp. IgM3_T14_3 TaxID=3415140 RepID=UPI003C6FF7C5
MKKLLLSIAFGFLIVPSICCQINQQLSKKPLKSTSQNIKLPEIDGLTPEVLQKLKIPRISISEAQKNAKPITSWEITPLRPKDNFLVLSEMVHGAYTLDAWILEPKPRIDLGRLIGHDLSALLLDFRQSAGSEYRIKIKLLNNPSWRGLLHIMVDTGYFSGYFPLDRDNNEVNAVFTANRSYNGKITISLFLKGVEPNIELATAIIQKITIDKI